MLRTKHPLSVLGLRPVPLRQPLVVYAQHFLVLEPLQTRRFSRIADARKLRRFSRIADARKLNAHHFYTTRLGTTSQS